MSNTLPSYYMNMPVPVVGQELGPAWALDINQCLSLSDSHDHTPGKGAPISQSSLIIVGPFDMSDNDLINTRSIRLFNNTLILDPSTLPGNSGLATDIGCVFNYSGDLWYTNTAGFPIQLTSGNAVVGAPGTITNLFAPASVVYNSGTHRFTFSQNTGVTADLACGTLYLSNDVLGSAVLTLAPPTSMATSYLLTLPLQPVSGTYFMTLDSNGLMSAGVNTANGIVGSMLNSNVVDNSTLQYTSSQLSIKANGVTASQIAPATITHSQISGSAGILGGQLSSSAGILGSQLETNPTINGIFEAYTGYPVPFVHFTGLGSPAAIGIVFMRSDDGEGTALAGGAYISSHPSTGIYVVSFNNSFSHAPAVTVSTTAGAHVTVDTITTANCRVVTYTSVSTLTDAPFNVIAIGQTN